MNPADSSSAGFSETAALIAGLGILKLALSPWQSRWCC
jgi:hypothetical protein